MDETESEGSKAGKFTKKDLSILMEQRNRPIVL
jgi:hypothetical protein